MISNRLGLSSIVVTVGTTKAQAADIANGLINTPLIWDITGADIALLISSIGGILFSIEKVFVIYLRYKESKRLRASEHGPGKDSEQRSTKPKDPE